MTCIITGVVLFDPANHRKVRGDLHQLGDDTYIINCVTNPHGQIAWVYGEPPDFDERVIAVNGTARDDYEVFERRGIFVILRDAATLNSIAIAYMKEGATA